MANGLEFAAAPAIGLRRDYVGAALRGLAKRSKDAGQARRLLALSAIYDGGSRGDAARLGGVGPQTVRHWVLAFNADGLIDRKAGGPSSKLSAEQWAGWPGW